MQTDQYDIVIFLISITAIVLFLAAFIVLLVYLYHQNKLKVQQKIISINVNHERSLMVAKLAVQEATFKDIAGELHDDIAQSLFAATVYLHTVGALDEPSAEMKITNSIKGITSTMNKIRDLSHSLNSDNFNRLGLEIALEVEVEKFLAFGLFTVDLKILGNPTVEDGKKDLAIFRIIQEALNNITKHSDAKNTKLVLQYFPNHLELLIADDGKGFEYPSSKNNSNSTGLTNIKTRVNMFNGELCIRSSIGQGTSIYIFIPNKL